MEGGGFSVSLHSCRTPSSSWLREPGNSPVSLCAKGGGIICSSTLVLGTALIAQSPSKGNGPFEQLRPDGDMLNVTAPSAWCVKSGPERCGRRGPSLADSSPLATEGRPVKGVGANTSHLRTRHLGPCTLHLRRRSRSPHPCWEGGCLQSQAQRAMLRDPQGTTPEVQCSTTRTTTCGSLRSSGPGYSRSSVG